MQRYQMPNYLLLNACLLLGFLALCLLPGCKASYQYFTFKSQAEVALAKNDLKKALELYSIIYQHETTAEKIDTERTTWAFYRLGVIAEVTGDVKMAKGYYWGDKIEEGFFQEQAIVGWLAQTGWNHLDEGNPPRTLKEILALESAGPKKAVIMPERKKREIVAPRDSGDTGSAKSEITHTRTFQRSLTPPRPNTPEPFKVFY